MSKAQPVASTASSYAILAKLATGGMAQIFLARTASATGVERYVVLKRVLPHRANDAVFVRMFLDEARLAAQLQHPNIAQVYDTGVLGDSYFFSMEYVHGETLREILQRSSTLQQPIPIACVLTIAAGAAAGLQHAHERNDVAGNPLGIVHRDVSPSNLMVSYEGNVKLVDFGVAKASDRRAETTEVGTVKGKISYLSPEQCRGSRGPGVDRRSDLFSLGIVMWEMLVGERLFNRATDYETMEAIVLQPTPPPSSRRAEVGPELDAIVMKLLEKDPSDRYQSGDELLEAIETCALRVGVSLSAAGLKRFVRELFGQRPEPWIELRTRASVTEIVTVTAAPMAGTHDVAIGDMRDSELARLLDLSSSIRVIPDAPSAMAAPAAPATAPALPLPSASRPAVAPAVEVVTDSSLTEHTAPRRWGAVALVLAAIFVILVIAIVVVVPGNHHAVVTRPAVATVVADAPALVPAQPPDAAAAAAAAPVVADAGVSPDAAAPPPDAEVHPDVVPPTPRPRPEPHPRAPREVTVDDLSDAFHAARFAEVIAACGATPKLLAKTPVCTLAACRTHDADRARQWLHLAPANTHDGLTAACQASGTFPAPVPDPKPPVAPKPPRPDACDDPMACRH